MSRPIHTRNYAAGYDSNLTTGWTREPMLATQILEHQANTLVARSREQYQNNELVKRYVRLCRTNIIGSTGIALSSLARDESGAYDKALASGIESDYEIWGKYEADYYREQPMRLLLMQSVNVLPIDGEFFWHVRADGGGPLGVSLELIESKYIPLDLFGALGNGNRIRFGIEFDQANRKQAYWIMRHRYDDDMTTFGGGALMGHFERIPADEMIHVYDREYARQPRGIPWCSTPLNTMRQMSKYREAAVVNARHGASTMVFLKSPDGTETDGDGYWPNGYKLQQIAPGRIESLPEGVEPIAFDPTYPTNEYETFMSSNSRLASAGMGSGASYESVSNDRSGVNFSSIRAGMIEDRDMWRELQQMTIDLALEPVLDRLFLRMSVTPGTALYDANAYRYWANATNHSWRRRSWASVDHLKDVQASQIEIEMGLKSKAQHMIEANRDPEQTRSEILEERMAEEQIEARATQEGVPL